MGGGSGSKLSGSRFVLRTQKSQGKPRARSRSGLTGWQGLWVVKCNGASKAKNAGKRLGWWPGEGRGWWRLGPSKGARGLSLGTWHAM